MSDSTPQAGPSHQDILDHAHDCVVHLGADGRILSWNGAATRTYGWSREEALGRTLAELFGPEAATSEAIDLAGAGVWEGEVSRRSRDGSVRALALRCVRSTGLADADMVVEIARDLTEERRLAAAARAGQERYDSLFHAVAASFWEVDFSGMVGWVRELRERGVTDLVAHLTAHPEDVREMMRRSRIVDVNDQTVALFGAGDREALLGSIEPFWPEASGPVFLQSVLAAFSKKPSFMSETRLRTLAGREFDVLFTCAYPPSDGPPRNVLVGVVDISARKAAHDALERSERRYRDLFHHMPIALWQLDARGLREVFVALHKQGVKDLAAHFDAHPEVLRRCMDVLTVDEVNERTVRMLGGRDAAEFRGPVTRFWTERPDTFRRAIEARFRGEPTFEEETRIPTLDGRVIDVLFSVARPEPFAELGISLIGLLDISNRKRAQEMLAQVQAEFAHASRVSMLGELTASIAHEVNQPLAAIATNAAAGLRWLARPEPDIAELNALTARIGADARRAADIIDRIRDMARRGETERSSLSLNGLIEEAALFLRHELESRRVRLHLDLDPDLPPVLADRVLLQQVLVNLAVNAAQAVSEDGRARREVAIATRGAGEGSVEVAVEDTGPGIPDERLPRLFESFFTTKAGGMGIGLPICRSIVEAHGGRIQAGNRTGEGGARFVFVLPSAQSAADHTNV